MKHSNDKINSTKAYKFRICQDKTCQEEIDKNLRLSQRLYDRLLERRITESKQNKESFYIERISSADNG